VSIGSVQGARRRKTIDLAAVSAVRVRPFDDNPLTPWVVEPASSGVDLAAWAAEGRDEVQQLLLDRGAVLFRGFGLRTGEEFEVVASALTSELYGGYGDLPREGSSQNIYKSTPYPADQPILFHSESSHLSSWPTRISFFCMTPSQTGGETPLADTREIARRLDPAVLEQFETKGLTYVRNFSGLDVSWQQFFQTEDRDEVARRCEAGGMEFEWRDGGDALRVRQRTMAVLAHPETGDKLFFNQIQLHHPYYLPQETRESLRAMVGSDDDLPRSVTFGDGSPISDEIAEHVMQTYWDTSVMFPWQQGDIISLDNMRIAHARMPFTGDRRIAVAMAGMTSA
jgi:alpha-ketoglutarate-dependent taurine dioxygenase